MFSLAFSLGGGTFEYLRLRISKVLASKNAPLCSYIDVTLVFEDSDNSATFRPSPLLAVSPQNQTSLVCPQPIVTDLTFLNPTRLFLYYHRCGEGPLLTKGLSTAAQLI